MCLACGMCILVLHMSVCVCNCILPPTAEVRKDVSGQFHNAICCGDIEERIKVLRSVRQGIRCIMKCNSDLQHSDTTDTLAYLTAKTHGLEEEAESIAASLGQNLDEVRCMYSYAASMYIAIHCYSK